MRYKIFLNGELVNIIIADEAFCIEHYSQNGYSYELEELPVIPTEDDPIDPRPTMEERMTSAEEDISTLADAVNILLGEGEANAQP